MSETARVWVEILFNISYLVVIWSMVILMTRRMDTVSLRNRPVANRVRWAFFLLALGDTGHVGFRVIAYALGGLEAQPILVGLGALATAITVTFFYVLMLDIWRLRFKKKFDWFAYLLLAAAAVRLVIMALPGNDWGSVVPPQPMGLYRNLGLMVQGLGVMALIFRDSARTNDKIFRNIAWMIAMSYTFYTPVILFVNTYPMLGMLMIPKTLAYIGVAFIAYRGLYPQGKTVSVPAKS
jgi:hypothetical protein